MSDDREAQRSSRETGDTASNEPTPSDSGGLPNCPDCGEPIVATTVVGPMEGYAAPCGCRVSPAALPDTGLE